MIFQKICKKNKIFPPSAINVLKTINCPPNVMLHPHPLSPIPNITLYNIEYPHKYRVYH